MLDLRHPPPSEFDLGAVAARVIPGPAETSEPEPIIVAYGAGVDSTAMLIGLRDRAVRPDLILFADTGSEKPETTAYLPIIGMWLAANGFPPITVLKRHSPRAGDTSLHGECLRKRVLPSLAYGGHSCSLKWKVEPQWRFTRDHYGWDARRQRWRHGLWVTKLIGYDSGPADGRRVARAVGKWPPGHRYRYPLIEWGWAREECQHVIQGEGLPLPVKSACFMCPASKRAEVDWLAATHPDLVTVSVEMERRAHERGLTTTRGLGRRWSWSEHLGQGDPGHPTGTVGQPVSNRRATGRPLLDLSGEMRMSDDDRIRCIYCGEPERIEIFEIWSGHEFMLETCCEAKHEELAAGMADDPAWARALLRRLEAEALAGHKLRRVADSDGCLVLDWQLDLQPVSFAAAREFVDRHHAHCAGPCAWRFGAAAWNGWTMIGVAMVGNPVAPAYSGRPILEVNRLCVRRDVPSPLRWNACSMLYGWAAREAARRGFAKIITHTREIEDGASLRAAGWAKEARIRGRGWHSARRCRRNENAWIDKDRWSRDLAPASPDGAGSVTPDPPRPIPSLDAVAAPAWSPFSSGTAPDLAAASGQ